MMTFAHFIYVSAFCVCVCFFSLFLSNSLKLSRSQSDAVVTTTVVPLVLPPSSSSYKSLSLITCVVLTLSRERDVYFLRSSFLGVLGFL